MEQDNGSKEILAEKSVPASEKDTSADPEATYELIASIGLGLAH